MGELEPASCLSFSRCGPDSELEAEPSSFHTSSYISQIVYALLFHNRCQHFSPDLGLLQTYLCSSQLDVAFLPPFSLSRLRQELFQHMKHLIPTIWLGLELIQSPIPGTHHRVTGVKTPGLYHSPNIPPGCCQRTVRTPRAP